MINTQGFERNHLPVIVTGRSKSPNDDRFSRIKRLHRRREKDWRSLDLKIKKKNLILKSFEQSNFNRKLLEFKDQFSSFSVNFPDVTRLERQKKTHFQEQLTKYRMFWEDLKQKGMISESRTYKNRSSIS